MCSLAQHLLRFGSLFLYVASASFPHLCFLLSRIFLFLKAYFFSIHQLYLFTLYIYIYCISPGNDTHYPPPPPIHSYYIYTHLSPPVSLSRSSPPLLPQNGLPFSIYYPPLGLAGTVLFAFAHTSSAAYYSDSFARKAAPPGLINQEVRTYPPFPLFHAHIASVLQAIFARENPI
ncbi:hypothetical protein BX070DRAFT_12482 [Coemansia spiralis]|nr:hypothetical protein BX070DRAFT_12482 [Coemansia spiralis]